jgi:hypothetical protein
MLEKVKELADFINVKVMKTSINCPDITFTIHKIVYPLYSLQDLRFIVASVEEVLGAAVSNDGTRSKQHVTVYSTTNHWSHLPVPPSQYAHNTPRADS